MCPFVGAAFFRFTGVVIFIKKMPPKKTQLTKNQNKAGTMAAQPKLGDIEPAICFGQLEVFYAFFRRTKARLLHFSRKTKTRI